MVTVNKKKLARAAFGIYILGVLCMTFVVRETMVLRMPDNRGVILEPFREVEAMLRQPDHLFWFMQIFLNVLLFIPFGSLLPLVSDKFRNPFGTVFCGFLFSFGIESMQYITGRGLTELDDMINNTFGAIIGYILFAGTSFLLKRQSSH
jgi:glycopeptide antibiotics resistance protein